MFEWITRVIGRLGYTGVAMLTFLENLVPPIPSELVIPLAGSTVWYWVGRSVGKRRLKRVDRPPRKMADAQPEGSRSGGLRARHRVVDDRPRVCGRRPAVLGVIV